MKIFSCIFYYLFDKCVYIYLKMYLLIVGYTFRAFFGPFCCLCNRELLAQTEAKMIHFDTLTVPPPRTKHSLMHNSTSGWFPGRKGSQVRFQTIV
jgi:hypothetical protein